MPSSGPRPNACGGRRRRGAATVGGLADLQAEAYREAFEQGLAEGREAGRAEVRAQVERLSGMFYDLAKPFEALDEEVERELLSSRWRWPGRSCVAS